jgi:hypothetical protein
VSRPPILFYCQHLLGLGHRQRAARLAAALSQAGQRVLFVTGGLPGPPLDLGGAEEILSGGTGAIALGVTVDGGEQMIVPSNTSPDRRYLWLDLVNQNPVHLEAGEHILSLTYAGTEPKRRETIDGLLIQPTVARRVFEGPAGEQLTLTYDTQTDEVRLDEAAP